MKAVIKKICLKNAVTAKVMAYALYIFYCVIKKEKKIEIMNQIAEYKNELLQNQYSKIIKDILFCKLYYQISIKYYFYYEFEKKSSIGRAEYISHAESNRIYDKISNYQAGEIFKDKYKCYETFKKYYKRDVIKISDESHFTLFKEFCSKHNSFIVKPLAEGLGEGIFKIDISDEMTLEKAFEIIINASPVVVEELIIESKEMAKFHPSSVNTVRFATYISNGTVKDLYATLRLGDGGRLVDNASAGGISANIDVETGIVCSKGYRKNGQTFVLHPNTGEQIAGVHIPQWQELITTVHELAKVVPQRKVVGWDMALTEDGWVMVEGNNHLSPESVQITKQRGIRKDLEVLN